MFGTRYPSDCVESVEGSEKKEIEGNTCSLFLRFAVADQSEKHHQLFKENLWNLYWQKNGHLRWSRMSNS